MSGRPGRRAAALHDSATVQESGSKLMGCPGVGRLRVDAEMAGHPHRGSGGALSSWGRCYAVTPKWSSGLLGYRCQYARYQSVGTGYVVRSSSAIYAARRRSCMNLALVLCSRGMHAAGRDNLRRGETFCSGPALTARQLGRQRDARVRKANQEPG
jgi:hypothetical protein